MPGKANYLLGKLNANHTAHPFPDFQLDPDVQHVPLDPSQSQLRPPKPVIISGGDDGSSSVASFTSNATVLVTTASFRDSKRCGYTLFTAFHRARHPHRVRALVVDQVLDGEERCLDAYCDLAAAEEAASAVAGESSTNNSSETQSCPYKDQIEIVERDARKSKGPAATRAVAQEHVRDDDELCLGVDAHSVFTNDWDLFVIKDWLDTENEMGVVTTYIHDAVDAVIAPNGDNRPWDATPYICDIKVGGAGLPRMEGATTVANVTRPILTSGLGAGFTFSKCHAERRVRIDPHHEWVFDGEEFSRAAQLWMSGYDLYNPTMYGHAVYHNYTGNPKQVTWNDENLMDVQNKAREEEMGNNRVKLHIGQPFEGLVNTKDFHLYSATEQARTLEQFLKFKGMDYDHPENWTHSCHQLHWVPYKHPEVVEAVVPGWRQEAEVIAIQSTDCIDLRMLETYNNVVSATRFASILGLFGFILVRRCRKKHCVI